MCFLNQKSSFFFLMKYYILKRSFIYLFFLNSLNVMIHFCNHLAPSVILLLEFTSDEKYRSQNPHQHKEMEDVMMHSPIDI